MFAIAHESGAGAPPTKGGLASTTQLDHDASARLDVSTEDGVGALVVYDANREVVARGAGELSTELGPGLYLVQCTLAGRVHEHALAMLGKPLAYRFSRASFDSPAPLDGTTKARDYHRAAAARACAERHVDLGRGSSIFLFARYWSPPDATLCKGRHPAARLSLHDSVGAMLVRFDEAGEVDRGVADPWSACTVGLDPGSYRLRYEREGGAASEQTLVASAGWQTQVWLLHRPNGRGFYPDARDGRDPWRLDPSDASMFLVREGERSDDDRPKRLVELARLALANRRGDMLPDGALAAPLRNESPLLGLLGAHLLLLREQRDEALLRAIVADLDRLLPGHPDVFALRLKLGDAAGQPAAPPMVRASWPFLIEGASERPELLPASSPCARIVSRLAGEGPWLAWASAGPEAPEEAAAPMPHPHGALEPPRPVEHEPAVGAPIVRVEGVARGGPYRVPGAASPGAMPAVLAPDAVGEARHPAFDAQVHALLGAGHEVAAFELAIGAFGPEVFGFIIDVLGNEDGAEEVFIATSTRLSRLLPALGRRWPVRTRAYVIACLEIAHFRESALGRGAGRTSENADRADPTSHVRTIVTAITTQVRAVRRLGLRREETTKLREELSVDDRIVLILHVDKRLTWDEIALAFVDPSAPRGGRALRREAARLRRRFRRITAHLTERARLMGLWP